MMGPEKAQEARQEIDVLVKGASDGELDEAAQSLARNAAMGGSDYNSEYESSLDHLKRQRQQLNASTVPN